MTHVIYQASSLRAMVRQLLPCAESKNISDSNYCSLGILSRKKTANNGSMDEESVFYAETHQPSFCMGLGMVLTTEEVMADNQHCVKVLTRDLDNALASFGQRMVHMSLQEEGDIMLSSLETHDENSNTPSAFTSRIVCVRGEKVDPLTLPGNTKKTDTDCLCSQEETERDTCILANKIELLDSLRFSVPLAATRGNGLRKQGVLLNLSRENARGGCQPEYVRHSQQPRPLVAGTPPSAPMHVGTGQRATLAFGPLMLRRGAVANADSLEAYRRRTGHPNRAV